MKIAFITGAFFPKAGGVQVQIHNIANKISNLGINVKLFIYNKTNLKNNRYKIIIFKKFLFNFIFFFKYYLNINLFFFLNSYVSSIINKEKIDVWHFNLLNFKSLILIHVLKNFNQKIIVTFHGVDIQVERSINYGYRLNKKYDILLKNTLKKIDKFTYISETIKKDLIELGVDKDKLVYCPNAVIIEKFQKSAEKKNYVNKILNFITVARFSEKKKGLDLIQETSIKLIEKNIMFKWKIIGENSEILNENKFIKSHSNFFDIIGNIENIDEEFFPHSDLINHYKSSDLYINLSRIESFGITFIESLASKIPVISFKSKGIEEVIRDDFNGFLIKNNNLSELVNKIDEIYHNRSIINNMKKNCVVSVEKFDLDKVSEKLIGIYKGLI